MGSDPFFQEGMQLSLEARDAEGTPASVQTRSSCMNLRLAAQKAVVGLMLVAASVGALAGPLGQMTSHAERTESSRPAATLVLKGHDAEKALSSIAPGVQKLLSKIEVRQDHLENETHVGPAALVKLDGDGKSICTISMTGAIEASDHSAKQMGSDHRFSKEQSAVLAELILYHETGHCEFHAARLNVNAGLENVVSQKIQAASAYSDAMESISDGASSFSIKAEELLAERYADSVGMLTYASKVFEGASSRSEIKDALKKFDFAMDAQMKNRQQETSWHDKLGFQFNGHDTQVVLRSVNNLVHNAARSPETMAQFKGHVLSGEGKSITALKLSVGSIRVESESIFAKQVTDAITKAQRLGPSEQSAEKLQSLHEVKGDWQGFKVDESAFEKSQMDFFKESDRLFAGSTVLAECSAISQALATSLMKRILQADAKPFSGKQLRAGI